MPESVVGVANGWRSKAGGWDPRASAWKSKGRNIPPRAYPKHKTPEYRIPRWFSKADHSQTKGHLPRFWADFSRAVPVQLTWLESVHCLPKKITSLWFLLSSSTLEQKSGGRNCLPGFNICMFLAHLSEPSELWFSYLWDEDYHWPLSPISESHEDPIK